MQKEMINDMINNSRGGLPYESDGDARRKFKITPLKGTNLGMAQAFFDL